MPWTRFHKPQAAQQLHEQEVDMQKTGSSQFSSARSVYSISTSYGTFERRESNSVAFTGFGFQDCVPVGIEVKLVTQRLARIQDKRVQLWDGEQLIGDNKQNLNAENTQLYGSDFDRWGLKTDYHIPVSSHSFGVVIDLQPHTEIPCSETVYIHSVSMRLFVPE